MILIPCWLVCVRWQRQLNGLLQRCLQQQQQNALRLAQQQQRAQQLQCLIADSDREIHGQNALYQALSPDGSYSRQRLFAVQGRQAVVQRQLAELRLQREAWQQEYRQSIAAIAQRGQRQRALLRQADNYRQIRYRQQRQQYQVRMLAEQCELEEIMVCRK